MQYTIFHTVSNTQWGGQERRVFNECRWMARRGHRIAIATPAGTPLYQRAQVQGWKVFDMSFRRRSAFRDYGRLRKIFRTIQPQVFNTHGNMDAKVGMPAAQRAEIPCIILSRHITPPVKNTVFNRFLYHTPHYIFTTAHCASRQIVGDLGVAPERVLTVSSGIIPPHDLPPREEARLWLTRELEMPSSTRFIGFVGRLDLAKGISDIVQAFGEIAPRYPDHCLVLVGESDDTRQLRARIDEMGLAHRICLPGYTDDPWKYYAAFDCKVLASQENEGIAQSLLEAMYARCPVIGTRVGGIPDVIRHGETGLLVPPKSPDFLAQAMDNLLQNRVETEGRRERAYEMIYQNHTLEAMGRRIESLVTPVLKQSI